jgi:Sulfotransferase domain
MRVIGAGMGRTGTLSLKVALERLGFAPCYHMLEVIDHPDHVPMWAAAARGEQSGWERALGGYLATTDWPACTFWRSLADAHPTARILLSVRDADRWYDSMLNTVHRIAGFARSAPPGAAPAEMRAFAAMVDTLVWQGTFGGRFEDRRHAIEVYRRHNEEVRRGVAPERLLVYELGAGWEPLCAFLGVPVPDEPFPHLNDTASFQARILERGGPDPAQLRPQGPQ